MRKPIVAGNWKMNGSLELANTLTNSVKQSQNDDVDIIIFPPFPLIAHVANQGVLTGGQTLSEHESGAFTGEVSGQLLKDVGANYVLVGHSERRTIFSESNTVLVQKFAQAQTSGLTPVLCVGETEAERESNQTESVIAEQVNAVIDQLGVAVLANSVIAYEPVWAIGTGKTATPEQAQAVHLFIRNLIAEHDVTIAQGLRILYGGSVNDKNSDVLFAQPDVDGGLVGGASLKADAFSAICQSAQRNA